MLEADQGVNTNLNLAWKTKETTNRRQIRSTVAIEEGTRKTSLNNISYTIVSKVLDQPFYN